MGENHNSVFFLHGLHPWLLTFNHFVVLNPFSIMEDCVMMKAQIFTAITNPSALDSYLKNSFPRAMAPLERSYQ